MITYGQHCMEFLNPRESLLSAVYLYVLEYISHICLWGSRFEYKRMYRVHQKQLRRSLQDEGGIPFVAQGTFFFFNLKILG